MDCKNIARVKSESARRIAMPPTRSSRVLHELKLIWEVALSSFKIRKQFGLGFNHLLNHNRISGRESPVLSQLGPSVLKAKEKNGRAHMK